MNVELVSGWVDGESVYIVERFDEDTRIRCLPAKWSAFFHSLDAEDRGSMQRLREVTGLRQVGDYTRIDFKHRWARKQVVYRIQSFNNGVRAAGGKGVDVLEGDVNPLRRLLSDFPNLSVCARPRLAWFDLETDSRNKFVDTREGKSRILSWAFVDHHGRDYVECLAADTDEAERDLIERFLLRARESDVLLAWNGDGFDFPVLSARATKLKAMPGGRFPLWHRWCWLDHLEVYRKYNMHAHESGDEKSSFKLDDVARNVLGEGKDAFDATRTWEHWAAGGDLREKLLRYNLKDAKLLPRIEAQTGYVALHVAVGHITRCFPDSLSLRATQQGDGFLIGLGAQFNHRWPTRVDRDGEDESYEGAFVLEPTRLGIIDDVHVCDFASLYPSIMRTWNMSPDTLVHGPDPEGGTCRLPGDRVPTRFRLDRRGMLPRALDELVAKRGEYTAKMDAAAPGSDEWNHYKRLSSAFKIVANSFYGISGSPFSRFFSRDVAQGVTQTGAWLIKSVVVPAAKALGLDPFYGDTDSAMVAGDRDAFARMVAELNASWPRITQELRCGECRLKLEFEKSFRRLVLVSKKRYAAAYSVYKGKPAGVDQKPEVKGLEYKRGDSVQLAREMQRELIGMLLAVGTPDVEALWVFVKRWRTRVLEGELLLDEIKLSQAVRSLDDYKLRYTTRLCTGSLGDGVYKKKTKCGHDFKHADVEDGEEKALPKCPRCRTPRKLASQPAHVRVAHMLAARGEEMREGTRIEYLVVQGETDRIEAVPAHDPGVLERIDRNYYWDNRIYPPCARVLAAVFPAVPWVETVAQRRRAERESAAQVNRGVVDDLPLFAPGRQ